MVAGPAKHCIFRYSLRLLLGVLTGVCLYLGIAGHRRANQRRLAELIISRASENQIQYDYQFPGATRADWLQRRWIRDWFCKVEFVVLDERSLDLAPQLDQFPDLEHLFLSLADDSDLEHLPPLNKLKTLGLDHSRITDRGLAHLHEKCPNLETLTVEFTQISDAGLVHLGALKKLESVVAWRTRITEEGAAQFQKSRPGCKIKRSDPLPTEE